MAKAKNKKPVKLSLLPADQPGPEPLVVAVPAPKASLALAIIARNAERTIAACLESVVPFVQQVVVCVDETTMDDTAKVARDHGAQVFPGLRVSEEHECPDHGAIKVQHFARARAESWSHLRTDADWWGWIDADDVLKGGEGLAAYLGGLPAEVEGVWLPYHYAQVDGSGPTTTLFHRERFVRPRVGWQWLHRVHEVLAPLHKPAEHCQWAICDQIAVYHQGQGHDTRAAALRNITCLEIDLEENPQDSRALFYLGNQYFALEDWGTASEYFRRSLATDNVYQSWQTAVYLSMSLERLGDMEGAVRAAYQGVEIVPYHPDPYYRLAALAMLRGDVQRCEFWTALADQLATPPFFVFKNPLDRPYNARVTLANAYRNAGYFPKARLQLERAAAVLPQVEVVQQGIAECRQIEQETLAAEAALSFLANCPDNEPLQRAAVAQLMGEERFWKFGRIRNAVVPLLLRERPRTQPRIVFWCGRSTEPWAPPSIEATGIGGSETAVIQIAKRFARDGWRVDVFNEPDKYEGLHDDVGYWGLERLQADESADVLVGWRNPEALQLPLARRASLLWCHDLNRGPDEGRVLPRWDRVLGVSAWHAEYLAQLYGLDNADHVPNGIELGRFAAEVQKVPFRCVYASSPDRGLPRLLQLWRALVAAEPKAELHIAYGWENIDKWMSVDPRLGTVKEEVERLLQEVPGVVWRGRLPQGELARLYQESYCWLYPTSFLEVSCISAMEAMAGGAVPVTSAAGALPETIGEAGVIVVGNTYTAAWFEFWVYCARAALSAPDLRLALAAKGRERVKSFTWDASYEKWQAIVQRLLLDGRESAEGKELVTA